VLRRRRRDRWIEGRHGQSLTGAVVESLITGIAPRPREEPPVPGPEGDVMRIGDPDVAALQNEYAGEEAPGATTPTPDQNLIDATGRAYGVDSAQTGALRTTAEILDRRDRSTHGPKDGRRL